MSQPAEPAADVEAPAHRGRRQLGLMWSATVLCLIAVAPFGERLTGGFGACPIKRWAGIPCPTCGTTRAALLLADWQFVEALRRFPLPTLGWIAFLGGGLVAGIWVLSGRDLPEPPTRLPAWVVWSGLAVVSVAWGYAIATGV